MYTRIKEELEWNLSFRKLGVSNHFISGSPIARGFAHGERYTESRRGDGGRRRYGDRVGNSPRYGSYEAMLEDTDIEAVYIPLPNHLHLEWIKNCADAGKHILCEKPLALSAAEAAESVEYAEKRGVRIMEAFMYRFHPQWRRALEIVRTGEIGPIRTIQTIFTYNNSNPSDIRNRLDVGGGGIRDIGCYAVSSARFLMQAEPVSAGSLVERDPVFGTDRLASAILDFGGARCVFTVGTQSWPAQQVDAYGASGSLTIEVPFNTFPDVPARLTVRVGIGLRTVETGPVDQYLLEFEAFARAVREAPSSPPADRWRTKKCSTHCSGREFRGWRMCKACTGARGSCEGSGPDGFRSRGAVQDFDADHTNDRARSTSTLPSVSVWSLFPAFTPIMQSAKVTVPIAAAGARIGVPMNEKLSPVASASRLVATASARSRTGFMISCSSSSGQPFSGCSPSTIILPPTNARMPNAIQWSTETMKFLKRLPAFQPRIGIAA